MTRWIKVALLLVVLAGGAVAAYRYYTREPVERITVIEVGLGTVEETVSATGSVQPTRTILVTTDPGVRVVAVYFREQDRVQKGQILVKLDDAELASQLSHHEANMRLSEANLANARLTRDRLRRLLDKGFAARQEVEQAERQVDLFATQIAERTSAIELVKTKQARTAVTAPIDGVVTRRFVDDGGLVGGMGQDPKVGGAGQLQPTSIAEIAALDSSQFHADVDQADVVKVRLLQPATIRLDSFPGKVFPATTREIGLGSEPDPTGRVRYAVKLRFETADGALVKSGMTGSASFLLAKKTQAVTLPPPVVLQHGDDELVFVVDGDRARLRKIKTGLHGETEIEVVSGLRAGDLVVDQGRTKVKDGRRVEILNAKR